MAYIISFYKYIYIYIKDKWYPFENKQEYNEKKKIIKTIIMIVSNLLEVESTIPTLLVG